MNIHSLRSRGLAFAAGVVMLAVSSLVSADPPSRVIRLGYVTGAVSFSPAGEDDWVQAAINRPLTIGDRLWVDSGARAELQIGGAVMRLNAGTSVTVLNLDDNITQLQLAQGTMNVRVRRFDPNQMLEIDTPNLAFTVTQPGQFQVGVDAEANATDVIVRRGQGEVFGEGASYVLDTQHPYRFFGTGLREYEALAAPRVDDFERWAAERDRVYDTSISARYVSPDVIGYQDLDAHGSWSNQPSYGNVWFPTRVESGWAPYRDGHWAWVDPWGWTWVDDAPWGFAVSHYGRWSNFGGRWGWVPGPVRTRAYYAPALVAFVGGNNFQLSISSGSVGGVAWFPLGPREVYRPWYSTSRRYFENVNVSNTVVNTTVINNYYNNTNVTNVNYVNRQVPGAMVAVPTTAFVQSQPVARSAVRVAPQMVATAPVAVLPALAPTERSVRGAAAQGEKPPARALERAVVARSTPAPTPPSFAAQQQELQARQGKPLEDAQRKELKAARTTPAPVVNVVAQPNAAPARTLPPPSALPAGVAGKDDRPGKGNEKAAAPAQRIAPPPQVAQPAATPQPEKSAADRGNGQPRSRQTEAPPSAAQAAPPAATPQPEKSAADRGNGQPRSRQTEAPPSAAQAAPPATPPAAQSQVARPPTAARTEQPGMAQQRARGEQRGPQSEAEKAAPPQVATPTPQPRVSSPAQARIQQHSPEQQQAEQQAAQARAAQQQARQAEQQQARQAQAAQQQARQAEQQQARQAQAVQQQARQAEQQQQARQAQAAQQQARQAEQQQARQAQAAQQQARQAEQQQARQAQAAQQQARQAEQQQARQAQAAQPQARQAQAAPPQPPESRQGGGKGNKKDDDEEQAKKQKGG